MKANFIGKQALAGAMALSLAACASTASDTTTADPLEGVNRTVFEANLVVDKAVIGPTARAYRKAVPADLRQGLTHFLNNLRTPVILTHDLLQGEWDRAGTTTKRFIVNTFLGLGFLDKASDMGLPRHDEDLGQTLAVWGVGDGLYLVLPLLGPSSARDLAGQAVDYTLDPVNLALDHHGLDTLIYTRTGLEALSFRADNDAQLKAAEESAIDFYALTRTAYQQLRAKEIANGRVDSEQPSDVGADAFDFDY